MGLNFILLAGGAPLDVVCDPLIHFWPLIEFLDFSDCFISSRVSSCRVIMGFFQDILEELF